MPELTLTGTQLKALRNRKNLTMEALASTLKVSTHTVLRWEHRGKKAIPQDRVPSVMAVLSENGATQATKLVNGTKRAKARGGAKIDYAAAAKRGFHEFLTGLEKTVSGMIDDVSSRTKSA